MIGLTILLTTVVSSLAETVQDNDERIVGGYPMDISKVPYQVSIQTTWGEHYCGGSLISANMVLTAAHCVEDDPRPKDVVIYLGSSDRTRGGVKIVAKNIRHHEKYNATLIHNDVALIRLSKSVKFTSKISPIKLAASDPAAGTFTIASGWGKLHQNDPDTSIPRMLQGVQLKTISRRSCRAAYGNSKIQNTNICAYTERKDTCRGDSGGPLTANKILVGVVSWGAGCAQRGSPGVYASVAGYKSWIDRNIATM